MNDLVLPWQPRLLSIMRIVAALLFMEHGLMKFFHFSVPQPGVSDPLPTLLLCAALIEVVGGALLAIGLFSRLAAFVCSGQMAVGYFISHAPKSFWPGANGGDLQRLAAGGLGQGRVYEVNEAGLKDACAAASCLGWRGRATSRRKPSRCSTAPTLRSASTTPKRAATRRARSARRQCTTPCSARPCSL